MQAKRGQSECIPDCGKEGVPPARQAASGAVCAQPQPPARELTNPGLSTPPFQPTLSSAAPGPAMQLSSRVALASAVTFGVGAASGAIGALVAVSRHSARSSAREDERRDSDPEPDVIGTVGRSQ
jgi:hypothetical protein